MRIFYFQTVIWYFNYYFYEYYWYSTAPEISLVLHQHCGIFPSAKLMYSSKSWTFLGINSITLNFLLYSLFYTESNVKKWFFNTNSIRMKGLFIRQCLLDLHFFYLINHVKADYCRFRVGPALKAHCTSYLPDIAVVLLIANWQFRRNSRLF